MLPFSREASFFTVGAHDTYQNPKPLVKQGLEGDIGEVAVFKKALSPAEVKAFYDSKEKSWRWK